MSASVNHLEIRGLELAYGDFVLMRDLNFEIRRGEVFVIMGGSGCGKSTLLKQLIGLKRTSEGEILFDGRDLAQAADDQMASALRRFGVLFQGGALWSAMTLLENVSLPLQKHTTLSDAEIDDLARLKLAWVGLAGFEDFYPSEISGGMVKRGGLARAMALDPEILFFDEPSAGLDPLSSRRLDDLILELRDSLGTTVVVVTHELSSLLRIADDSIFLSVERRTATARGKPSELLTTAEDPAVREFLRRGEKAEGRTSETTVKTI
jgi:phospholipid/cholesterol/gamma-HCH transport system ATP-binding protein